MEKEVLVLGAGVQGCCIALELANRGYGIKLLDQDTIPFNRSSIRNEGKIHLGLVYVNDPAFETPELMLKAAFRFTTYLSRWIGAKSTDLNISTPFYYLVSNESILDTTQLEKRYDQLYAVYNEMQEDGPERDYLGFKPGWLTRKCTDDLISRHFNMEYLQGGFLTEELAIDTSKLAKHITNAVINHPNISFFGGHKIISIFKNGSGYYVEGENSKGIWKMHSPQVVNATWTDKFRLDESIGIPAPKDILHRLKYRVIADIPSDMINHPSATMVIGRFGDVVIRPDSTAYVSWYPEACKGWSNSLQPPEEWNEPSRGIVSNDDFEQLSRKFIEETAKWYPAIKNCKPKKVDAGIIVAHGRTDVNDADSKLHKRTKIGVNSYGGYHSVETGKLTTAPMFALDTADHVDDVYQQL